MGHTEEEPERQRGRDYNCRNVIIYGMCPLGKEAEFTQCWGRKGGGMGGPHGNKKSPASRTADKL